MTLKVNKTAKVIINRIIWIAMFLVLGILITNQYILYKKINLISSPEEPQSKALRVSRLYSDNTKLREQLSSSTAHRDDLLAATSSSQDTQRILQAEIQKYKIIIGEGEVQGPGVTLSIAHTLMLTQMVDLVNALRNSGAEAIAINKKRIITTTSMNDFKEKPNYMIQAIGNQEVLYDSLTRPGGILDSITNGNVEKTPNLSLSSI